MTKYDLAQELSFLQGTTVAQATRDIEALLQVMSEAFIDGKNIYLRGFGTFKIVDRKAKLARNIKAGTLIEVPEHKVVKFVPCPELKAAVR